MREVILFPRPISFVTCRKNRAIIAHRVLINTLSGVLWSFAANLFQRRRIVV